MDGIEKSMEIIAHGGEGKSQRGRFRGGGEAFETVPRGDRKVPSVSQRVTVL